MTTQSGSRRESLPGVRPARAYRVLALLAALTVPAISFVRAEEPSCRPPFIFSTLYPMPELPQAIQAIDLNGDGFLDVAMDTYNSASITVRLGQPDGTLGPLIESPTVGGPPWAFTTGAFVTGAPPGAVIATQQGDLYFYAGNGDGTFQAGAQIAPGYLYDLVASDVNHDGKVDLVGIAPSFDGVVV